MKQVWLWILALLVIMVWAETFVSSKVLLDYGLMPADIFFYRFILSYVCLIFLSHKRVLCMSWLPPVSMAELKSHTAVSVGITTNS